MKKHFIFMFAAVSIMFTILTNCSEKMLVEPEPEIENKLVSLYGTIKGDGILVYNDPLNNVEITLIYEDSSESFTTSNVQGEFVFDSLSTGEYRIEFFKEVPFNNYLYLTDSMEIIDSNDIVDTFYFSSYRDNYFPIDSGFVWEYKGSESFWPAPGGEYIDSVNIRIETLSRTVKSNYIEFQASLKKTVFWKYIHFGYIGGEFVEDTSFYTNDVTISEGNYIEKEGLVYNVFYPGFHAYPKGNDFFQEVFDCREELFCHLDFSSGDLFAYNGEMYNTIRVDVDQSMGHKVYEYVKGIGLVTIDDVIGGNSVWANEYVLVNHLGTE
jgi:hypothetical protein